jgi:hypothetical protein
MALGTSLKQPEAAQLVAMTGQVVTRSLIVRIIMFRLSFIRFLFVFFGKRIRKGEEERNELPHLLSPVLRRLSPVIFPYQLSAKYSFFDTI